MTTLTATMARREFFDLVKGAAEGHRSYRIQHRRGVAILMSEEDYEGLVETLDLLSVPGFRRKLSTSLRQMKTGKTVSMDELFRKKT
ncbi:MAG: type II toxin-antitoxin system Phd/YefM family antitoxin [Nitrospirae bacterium]|nr:type II toxin-antitoxin system Phd/YefM family antitoxin [Nitrospirota bacterium]